jgi:hypothetical protein
VTSPVASPQAGELDRPPPFEPALVEELLRLFGKAARAHQLYLPNNPIYKSAHDALRAGFVPLWGETDELVLSFTESEVRWEGLSVLSEGSRGSDSLPWLFYKDGVRELRFLRGFEAEELDKLLGIMQRVRKASPDEDDLLTLLWEGDFIFLRYRYVDLTLETAPVLARGDGSGATTRRPARVEETSRRRAPASSTCRTSTARSTSSTSGDRVLQTEVDREYRADLRQNVIAILLDIFEQQSATAVRDEVIELLDVLMVHMLSAAQFQNVAYLMRESQLSASRAPESRRAHGAPGADPDASQRSGRGRAAAAVDGRRGNAAADDRPVAALRAACADPRWPRCSSGSRRCRTSSPSAAGRGSVATRVAEYGGAREADRIAHARCRPRGGTTRRRAQDTGRRRAAREGARRGRRAPPRRRRAGARRDRLARRTAVAGARPRRRRARRARGRGPSAVGAQLSSGAGEARCDREGQGAARREPDGEDGGLRGLWRLVRRRGRRVLDAMLNGKSLFGRREDTELRACAAVRWGA